MEKIEIVNKIIDFLKNNNSGLIESGILKIRIKEVTIKYFISLKELWQFSEVGFITEKNATRKLAKLMLIGSEIDLVDSVTEIELLMILDELEKSKI